MRSSNLNRRSSPSFSRQVFAGRGSVQIVVGALAIAAIVLAFTTFRSGDPSQEGKPAAAPARATVVEAGFVAPAPTALPRPTVAPSSAPAPAASSGGRTHTVASGDTLSSIAKQYYGDASRWTKVFEANRDILPDANSLKLGQKLKIPD